MRATDMNCKSCKAEINTESAIDGCCARCARPEKAPEPERAAPMKQKLEAAGETTLPDNPDHDEPHYEAARAKTEPAHLGHAHAKAEPADHGKSSKHK